jgi:hypothetical protein
MFFSAIAGLIVTTLPGRLIGLKSAARRQCLFLTSRVVPQTAFEEIGAQKGSYTGTKPDPFPQNLVDLLFRNSCFSSEM